MNEQTKKIIFVILFISCIFLIVMCILVFFIAPQKRLGTLLLLLWGIASLILFYFWLYKNEPLEKRRLKIIVSMTGLIFTANAIYYLYKGSLTPLDKLIYPFLILIFGLGSILVLIGRMQVKGTIIDNLCASSQKPEDLAEFIKTHPKSCAIKPACASSGYSIYFYEKLHKFDKASNEKVGTFLKKEDSKLEVEVLVKQTDEGLRLITIENQKNTAYAL